MSIGLFSVGIFGLVIQRVREIERENLAMRDSPFPFIKISIMPLRLLQSQHLCEVAEQRLEPLG